MKSLIALSTEGFTMRTPLPTPITAHSGHLNSTAWVLWLYPKLYPTTPRGGPNPNPSHMYTSNCVHTLYSNPNTNRNPSPEFYVAILHYYLNANKKIRPALLYYHSFIHILFHFYLLSLHYYTLCNNWSNETHDNTNQEHPVTCR